MRKWALAVLLLASPAVTWSQPAPVKTREGAAVDAGSCCLVDATQRLMRATGSGREYRIYIALPKGPAPSEG